MAKFLIDVNLPYHVSFWNSKDYLHVKNMNDEWSDSEIWDYAKANKLTIITKDADFSNRILTSKPPPKVVHIKIGNLKFRKFFEVVSKQWEDVKLLNRNHKLVNIFIDRIEGIN